MGKEIRWWDFQNACMQIASRCNQTFNKTFIMNLKVNDMDKNLTIDAYPCKNFTNAQYSIHMIGNYNLLSFEVKLRFEKIDLYELDEGALSLYAHNMGYGISENYMIALNKNGFVFILDECPYYPVFEDTYEFVDYNGDQKVRSVNPLLHFAQTAFDTEIFLYFFTGLNIQGAIKSLKKNGYDLCDIEPRGKSHDIGNLYIYKKPEGFKVISSGKTFFSNPINKMKVMSYISQYSLLGNMPTIKSEKIRNPLILVYFCSDEKNNVRIELLLNFGLSASDVSNSIIEICRELGVSSNLDWANTIL